MIPSAFPVKDRHIQREHGIMPAARLARPASRSGDITVARIQRFHAHPLLSLGSPALRPNSPRTKIQKIDIVIMAVLLGKLLEVPVLTNARTLNAISTVLVPTSSRSRVAIARQESDYSDERNVLAEGTEEGC